MSSFTAPLLEGETLKPVSVQGFFLEHRRHSTVWQSANNSGPACRTLGWLAVAWVGICHNVPGLFFWN
jgi:hypothetical protein